VYSQKTVTYHPRYKENIFCSLMEESQAIWKSRQVALNIFSVRLSERYEGAYLGIAWSVIAPVLTMLAIAIVFPFLMRFKIENYIVYLFSGLLAWRFISTALMAGGESIIGYKELIQKVPLPTMLYPIVVIAIEFVNLILVMSVLYVFAVFFGYSLNIHPFYLLVTIFVTLVFTIGLASLLSVLITYFRDVRQILDVGIQAFFYLTPIIYPTSMIPDKYAPLMECNVFFQFIRLFHQAIYSPVPPVWQYMLIPSVIASIVCIAGLIVHRRYGRQLVFRL